MGFQVVIHVLRSVWAQRQVVGIIAARTDWAIHRTGQGGRLGGIAASLHAPVH
jgi:hypothetical protein